MIGDDPTVPVPFRLLVSVVGFLYVEGASLCEHTDTL